MRPTRRSVLKSGVAGLAGVVAAGSGAASGSAAVSPAPKAVITINGGIFGVQNGGYLVGTSVFASNNGGTIQFTGEFVIDSFSASEAFAKNIPIIIETIVSLGGARLNPEDLLFVGFDFFRG